MNIPFFHLFFFILTFSSCSLEVDTGRNADPSKWPADQDEAENEELPLALDETNEVPSTTNPLVKPDASGSQPVQRSGCLSKMLTPLQGFSELCGHIGVQNRPEIANLLNYICEKRLFDRAMSTQACAWDGSNPKDSMKYRFVLSQVNEQSGLNYADVVAFFVQIKVPKVVFSDRLSLAFENFAKFRSQGFFWASGTREQTNLSNTTMDQGLTYRFALEKESYELGYHGFIQRYELPSGMSYYVNIAKPPYTRVTHFSQISAVQPQADGTSIVMVLEDKGVDSSNGLYRRARSSSKDLTLDLMSKTSLLGR